MNEITLYSFYIDLQTDSLSLAVRTLKRLKTTIRIESDGAYREDPLLSRIYIETFKREEELEEWLYNGNHGINYIGVCEAPLRD